MTAPTCHPDRPYKARGMCKACWAKDVRDNPPSHRASRRASVLAPAPTEAPLDAVTVAPQAPRTAPKARKHSNHYGGPLCPADPEHGPLLAFEGMAGYWCPHSGHAKPGAHTPSRFTTDEVEAATAARLVAS